MAEHPGPLSTPTANGDKDGPVIEARNLVRGFDGRAVLRGVDLTIRRGEFVALLGRSGSGKSTLLRAIAGLDDGVPGSGVLEVDPRRAVVFQDSRLLPWSRVLDNVILGLGGADAEGVGRELLREVELDGREKAWPRELSGGQQQRVALARSLVREPAVLLADEPFGALDALTKLKMHDLLRRLVARHRPGVLLITHDVDEAIALADRILVLDHGILSVDVTLSDGAGRRPGESGFAELRGSLLDALGVEQDSVVAATA
ncbi:ABC transporter ATP-binding protein [Tsukamurella ocularis]|uniref:ABC transporter ATP-binding protein n=1 Tax=Tsukamurella ocularis TaxID=1970234 RepID=UPI0021693D49|nr:ABC transporter ATP-binding protein [Tsukamurella ocularis]MCS3781799.1 sulfonate transport system ATP-binding protein [Tsukamurella ocularis]MCS3788293.1 sulfonate transport system ATP-binding protein [Tsukamurella ocularis]MCS3852013.1 sulfonate transport system ATP-binding protein [Tsukamurella ocularis]